MNGKLLWGQLEIVKIEWREIIKGAGYGSIHINIPMQLNITYDPRGDTGWSIRKVVHQKLIDLKWPVGDINNLFFAYYKNDYYIALRTNEKITVDFYENLRVVRLKKKQDRDASLMFDSLFRSGPQ